MATAKCRTCGEGDSIAFCSETGAPICAKCAVSCDVCNAPLSKERAQLTSTGRKLCSSCMAARNARRREKKEELRREASEKKRAAADAAPVSAARGGVSFEDLLRDDPALSRDLRGAIREEAPIRAPVQAETPKSSGTAFQDLLSKSDAEEPGKAPKSAMAREVGLESANKSDEEENAYGLEGRAKEGSSRLTLGPIDDNRPVLTGSGYQPPSRLAYLAVFALFGLAAAIFWPVVGGIRGIMFPGQQVGAQYTSDLLPVATSTNALRNVSNISQFDLFSQAPVFFIAWLFFLAYTIGFVLILWSVGRSLISSYLAKRRLKKAEEYAKKHGYSYPG